MVSVSLAWISPWGELLTLGLTEGWREPYNRTSSAQRAGLATDSRRGTG